MGLSIVVQRRLFSRRGCAAGIEPRVVVTRLVRMVPRCCPKTRSLVKTLASGSQCLSWRNLDEIREALVNEFDCTPPGDIEDHAGTGSRVRALSDALYWGCAEQCGAPATSSFQCGYCWRPANVRRRDGVLVCTTHVPATRGARHAARLERWAGGYYDLVHRKNAACQRVSARTRQMPDDQRMEVFSSADVPELARDPGDVVLLVSILAWRQIDEEYKQWVVEQCAKNGVKGGVTGHAVNGSGSSVNGSACSVADHAMTTNTL